MPEKCSSDRDGDRGRGGRGLCLCWTYPVNHCASPCHRRTLAQGVDKPFRPLVENIQPEEPQGEVPARPALPDSLNRPWTQLPPPCGSSFPRFRGLQPTGEAAGVWLRRASSVSRGSAPSAPTLEWEVSAGVTFARLQRTGSRPGPAVCRGDVEPLHCTAT